jgi:pyrroline-5-carboxylate reductase
MDTKPCIGFIGGGNMATSLLGGLMENGFAPTGLRVADPDSERLAGLGERFGVAVETDNTAVADWADILVLAVKPQIMRQVVQALAPRLIARPPLVISIAAGITSTAIQRWAGASIPLIRVMPNTPALVKTGMSALFAAPGLDAVQRQNGEDILGAVGQTVWVDDESELDAVTAISGSGPAYFFAFMEALQSAGEALGLPPETANQLTLQTALGAARMAQSSDVGPAELRRRVTSPGGTTERALAELETGGFAGLVAGAAEAAARRSRQLAEELGNTGSQK